MYKDLRGDFAKGEDFELDTSFDDIEMEMGNVVKEAGVHQETPDGTSLSDTVRKLRAFHVNPDYIVTSGNPKAKTVVLFMQIHSMSGMTNEMADELGVTQSQAQIKEGIGNAVRTGFVKDVYEEFVESTRVLDGSSLLKEYNSDTSMRQATFQLKEELGERMVLKGYDVDELKSFVFMDDPDKEKDDRYFEHRTKAHNVFIASNLAERVNASDQNISFVTLGIGHEKLPQGERHPVRISDCLAYYGFNVIVVDTSGRSKVYKMTK
jgi:hypothetical protein